MSIITLEELLARYDIARTYANHGSYDKWFVEKFKLTRFKESTIYKKLHQKTYTVPFAKTVFDTQIRADLLELRAHYTIMQKRRGINDFESSQAIERINRYLEQIKLPAKKNYLSRIIQTKEALIGIMSLPAFGAMMAFGEQYLPFIVLAGAIALPVICQIMTDKAFVYFSKRLWYRTVKKRLGIDGLLKRLTKELVAVNDASFV